MRALASSDSDNTDASPPPVLPPVEVVQAIMTAGTGEPSFLTNRHVKELRRRGKGIRHGYLVIKIEDFRVVGIGDAKFNLFS